MRVRVPFRLPQACGRKSAGYDGLMRRMFLVVLLMQTVTGWTADLTPPPAKEKPLDYFLVITGEELLRGAYPDAHTCYITRQLHLLGCHCVGSMIVDDRVEDIIQALRLVADKAPLTIVTGGLGPTVNDITRDALADFTGVPLREQPEVLAEMENRFHQTRDQLRPNLRRQTLVPTRGTYLKNPNGTAVGLVFELNPRVIVALPGPPRELQPMVTNELAPYLRKKFGVRSPGTSLTLRFVGMGQSQIDQIMREHALVPADVTVGSVFEGSRVDFIFALPGHSPADLARLKKIEEGCRRYLGDSLYANDTSTLEDQVVGRLRERGGALALVEVGSGGHVAGSLDGVKDIAHLLNAAYVAPTEDQMRPMLGISQTNWNTWAGAARLKGMGVAARELTHSQWLLVVGQPTADPTNGPSVLVGLRFPDGEWQIQSQTIRGTGEIAHANLTTQILDWMRRKLK